MPEQPPSFITKWGSPGTADGQFDFPEGVALDSSDNVYVVDALGGNHRIQKFYSDGTFITKWGSFGKGDGQFHFPSGVAVDSSGNVYVADIENNRIQKFGSASPPLGG
jgi:tripartite motif-containing protein 71